MAEPAYRRGWRVRVITHPDGTVEILLESP